MGTFKQLKKNLQKKGTLCDLLAENSVSATMCSVIKKVKCERFNMEHSLLLIL